MICPLDPFRAAACSSFFDCLDRSLTVRCNLCLWSESGEHRGGKLGEKRSELGGDEVHPGCGVCVAVVGAYYGHSRSWRLHTLEEVSYYAPTFLGHVAECLEKMLGDLTFKRAKSFWYKYLGHIKGLNSYISL